MRITEPPRFLVDENLSIQLVAGVLRQNSAVDILHVSDPSAPGKGTDDPEVLRFCEREHRALITNNRKSMPGHLAQFAAEGHHH